MEMKTHRARFACLPAKVGPLFIPGLPSPGNSFGNNKGRGMKACILR